jgi:O-antigen ligase
MTLATYRQLCTRAGLFFLFLTCLFIPFSTSLMGTAAMVTALFWLLSGKVFALPRLMAGNLPVFLAIALFLLLALGVSYSPAPLPESLAVLKKYRELLYLAITVSLVAEHERAAKSAEYGFVAGCVILLAASYAMFFALIPSNKFGYSTVYHITHSFFMAVLAFWSLQQAFSRGWPRFFWLLLFVASSINLFYIAPGRTGMLVYLALVALTLVQRFSVKRSLAAGCLAALLLGAAYFSSSNFSSRLHEAVSEVREYQAESSRSRTSLGMRFDWWQNSRMLIAEKTALRPRHRFLPPGPGRVDRRQRDPAHRQPP